MYSVGSSGNYWCQNMFSLPGNFYFQFNGLYSLQPDTSTNGNATEAMFLNRRSATPNGTNNTFAGLGSGDYHTARSSPLAGLTLGEVEPLLSHDLSGRKWTAANLAAGPYIQADEMNATTMNVTTGTVGGGQ